MASVTKLTPALGLPTLVSLEIRGAKLRSSPTLPPQSRLTRAVDVDARRRTKTSVESLSSLPETRLAASEAKATVWPSPDSEGLKLSPSPGAEPLSGTETSSVVPPARSRQKMSVLPLVSSSTRSLASDEKATFVPSPFRLGSSLASPPGPPGTG